MRIHIEVRPGLLLGEVILTQATPPIATHFSVACSVICQTVCRLSLLCT